MTTNTDQIQDSEEAVTVSFDLPVELADKLDKYTKLSRLGGDEGAFTPDEIVSAALSAYLDGAQDALEEVVKEVLDEVAAEQG